jgi:hypothetical protein
VIAYKFLRAGGIGPFTEHEWPLPAGGEPGDWVEAGGEPRLCELGVHACAAEDLALWLDAELWRIELDGVMDSQRGKVAARRGRLLERVAGWDVEAAAEFGAACAQRVADRAAATAQEAGGDEQRSGWVRKAQDMAGDAAAYATGQAGDPERPIALAATAAYIAAESAVHFEGAEDAAGEERAWQGAWLAARLGLSGE